MRKLRGTQTAAIVAALTAVAVLPTSAQAVDSGLPGLTATTETPALYGDDAGGNADADDPAIWRNTADPDASLVISTAKEGGLRVYDLAGKEVQSIPAPPAPTPDDKPGRFNNVDLVSGFPLPTGRADVAVVTDRGRDHLRIYRITPGAARPLTDITDPNAPLVFSKTLDEVNDQTTPYGLATWTDKATGRSYAVVSRRSRTRLALLELRTTSTGAVTYRQVRTYDLPASFTLPDGTSWTPCTDPGDLAQVEGMVVDPVNKVLYAGQEDVGIWRMPADLGGKPKLIDKVREYGVPATYDEATEECVTGADPGYGGTHLSADVEGLTILDEGSGDGYLLASSQGDNTFAAYDREVSDDNEYESGFRITAGTVDGSEECDGAAVLNAPLGSRYPNGLLVVQDGHNTPDERDEDGEVRDNTDFKFVDLAKVTRALDD
ncbi:phytase [Streptomyces sp. NRRL S-455]|uniref:phytase n=1 Tax=Streptomyces sp. NRRL S-455 TaxID=1463908 RepID=UPI00056243F6|nr:phytase [Streptomyces sp. NRRL S-455]